MTVPVTFVLTSCRRFDLLERTLASFLISNDYPIARYIIIEDSPDRGVLAMRERFPDVPLEIYLNDPAVGQMRSIDRAYAMVETEFVFHCEDDWLFTRPGVIESSLALLQAFSNVTMVLPVSPGRSGPDRQAAHRNGIRCALPPHRSAQASSLGRPVAQSGP